MKLRHPHSLCRNQPCFSSLQSPSSMSFIPTLFSTHPSWETKLWLFNVTSLNQKNLDAHFCTKLSLPWLLLPDSHPFTLDQDKQIFKFVTFNWSFFELAWLSPGVGKDIFQLNSNMHTYTHIHTYMHAYIHKYTHS